MIMGLNWFLIGKSFHWKAFSERERKRKKSLNRNFSRKNRMQLVLMKEIVFKRFYANQMGKRLIHMKDLSKLLSSVLFCMWTFFYGQKMDWKYIILLFFIKFQHLKSDFNQFQFYAFVCMYSVNHVETNRLTRKKSNIARTMWNFSIVE